jgi:hypothetical protein
MTETEQNTYDTYDRVLNAIGFGGRHDEVFASSLTDWRINYSTGEYSFKSFPRINGAITDHELASCEQEIASNPEIDFSFSGFVVGAVTARKVLNDPVLLLAALKLLSLKQAQDELDSYLDKVRKNLGQPPSASEKRTYLH